MSCIVFVSFFTGCNDPIDIGIKIQIQKHTLSNGLKLIMIEDHTVSVISYQSWFRVGSIDEPTGKSGMAHLFEHLMFKGTDRFGPKRFFTDLEMKGAEVNAFTDKEYTCYYENIVPTLLEKTIELESDRLANLAVSDKELYSELAVVLEERKQRYENSPGGKLHEALWDLAYLRHPYRVPVIGYVEDLIHIRNEDLKNFFKKYYHPGNLTIVVVGDFDADKTRALIEKYYAPIRAFDGPPKKRIFPVEPPQDEERRLVLEDQVGATQWMMGYPIGRADDPDSYAIDLLEGILFRGESSRVYRRVVEDKKLASDISGSSYTPSYPGLFMISGVLKPGKKIEDVEHEMGLVIEDVAQNGVLESELELSRKHLLRQILDSISTPQGLAQFVGTVEMVTGDVSVFQKNLSKYFKVKSSDIQRVAAEYFGPNRKNIVILNSAKKTGKRS